MRADNRGEGGILALLALVRPQRRGRSGRRPRGWSRSGCSAPRCSTATASSRRPSRCSARWRASRWRRRRSQHWIVPITVGDHLASVRGAAPRHGRHRRVFGPIMVVWFICIAVLGVHGIMRHPSVLRRAQSLVCRAASSGDTAGTASWSWARWCWWSPAPRRCTPTWGTSASARSGWPGSPWCCRRCCSTTSARVPSCSTTRRPPRNPFYSLVPGWALYPMVGIATAAAIWPRRH